MKVQFLDTVEDSHPVVRPNAEGKPEAKFLVNKFRKGQEVDVGSDLMPEDRAANLERLGYVKRI